MSVDDLPIPSGENPPDLHLMVRFRLGVYIGQRRVGNTDLKVHIAPAWKDPISNESVTYCGILFGPGLSKVLYFNNNSREWGQVCEECLQRCVRQMLPEKVVARVSAEAPAGRPQLEAPQLSLPHR